MKSYFFSLMLMVAAVAATVSFAGSQAGRRAPASITGAIANTLMRIHSHNDYNQPHPLNDALAEHLYSVEADIWLKDGEIMVSHYPFLFKGSLEDLYLKPLQSRVGREKSVYGDNEPFFLWIDIKESSVPLLVKLNDVLNHYSMLTTFTDKKVEKSAVTVVLTGDDEMKSAYVHLFQTRKAMRDSTAISADDPDGDNQWGWYSLNWNLIHGSFDRLKGMVALAHAKHRKIRFWNIPDERSAWGDAFDAGVDQISADNLHEIRGFFLSRF